MRPFAIASVVALILSSVSSAEVKNVPYPEVKVNVGEPYQEDAAFRRMHEAFIAATAKRDTEVLLRLVGPTFFWTTNLIPAEMFDIGRDPTHNFKVAFGFRGVDRNVDGGVDGGPFWNTLAAFAGETMFYEVAGIRNLVCGPLAAEIADEEAFERARKTVGTGDAHSHWYFTVSDTSATAAPVNTGPTVANLGTVAVPLLKTHPPGGPATHVQVLLSSGKPGWIPVSAARPLVSDRLCYAKTRDGDWKIAAFEKSGS